MRVTLLSSLASFASLSSVWVRNLSVSSVCRPFTTTSTPPPPRVRPDCGCSPTVVRRGRLGETLRSADRSPARGGSDGGGRDDVGARRAQRLGTFGERHAGRQQVVDE